MNPYLVSWLRFNDENDIAKDECGNTWTVIGSPAVSTENAILGKALQIGGDNKGSLTLSKNLIEAGQDFSVDAYVTVKSLSSGVGVPIYLTGNNYSWTVASFSSSRSSSKLQCDRISPPGTFIMSYFPDGSVQIGERHHFAWSYTHHNNRHYWILDGSTVQLADHALWDGTVPLDTINISVARAVFSVSIDEFRIFAGIALWTEPFTPPTTEADYDLTELSFSVFMPATRSIIKPIDTLANTKRTVDKTADEFSNVSSEVVRSENIFSNVNRTVDKSAEEFSNVKRTVNFSAVNDFSPIRRTVNVDDNFANVKRTVNFSTENFSATKRGVVFSEEYDFQPQRRLTNLADEFAPVRRLVHEPQVVDVYTRRRLTNLDDNFADVRRKILSTSDNAIDLSRAVIFTADNFSPTKRTVNKTATESANVKRQILFSADNDLPNVRRVINADDNFANVQSSVIKSADNFSPTKREILRSEICYVETSRRADLRSVIIALKNQQGNILGRIRFQKDKTSSIGHLVTRFNGIIFYAGLVDVDSPNASNFRVNANGNIYSLKEEFL